MWLSAGPPPNSRERRNRSTAKEKTTKQPPNAETNRQQRKKTTKAAANAETNQQQRKKSTKAAANAETASKGNTTKQPPKQKLIDSKRKTTIARCYGGIRKRDSPTAPIRATS